MVKRNVARVINSRAGGREQDRSRSSLEDHLGRSASPAPRAVRTRGDQVRRRARRDAAVLFERVPLSISTRAKIGLSLTEKAQHAGHSAGCEILQPRHSHDAAVLCGERTDSA